MLINFKMLNEDQKAEILSWRNHENVRKWMYQDNVITPEQHGIFMESEKADLSWVAMDESGCGIGVIAFNRIDIRNKNAYFAIYANPFNKMPGAGRILDSESIKLAKDFKLHTLKLEVFESNKEVINLHKKMGFIEEGRLKEFVIRDDIYEDVIVMGIML